MTEQTLQDTPLEAIARACQRETIRFQRDGSSDPRYCLEIFRRALRLQHGSTGSHGIQPIYLDEGAREVLVSLYTEYILAQINRSALPRQVHSELTQDVWRNFWQAANHGLTFPTLAAALAYLRQVTVSEIIKYRRSTYRRAREESMQALEERAGDAPLFSSLTDLFETHARGRFRERCAEVLSDTFEYRIFWLRYGLGYTPQEIARRLTEGDVRQERRYTARNISDILERCFRRLSEDTEIRALLQSD